MDLARFIATEIVPESVLRDFSRYGEGLETIVCGQNENTEKQLKSVLKSFIKTAYRIDVTPSHRAAATNAICSILEVQNVKHLQDIFQEEDVPLQAFDVVFDRSEIAKGKSMRQLLVALINVTKHQEPILKQRLVKTLLLRTFSIICRQGDRVKGKAALQVLSTFLSQGLIGLEQLAKEFFDFEAKGGGHSEAGSVRLAEQVQELLQRLFSWVGNRDTGRVVRHTILICVREWKTLQFADDKGQAPKGLPIWVRPLVQSILEHPEALQAFKNQAFPELFAINTTDYLAFLEHLGLQKFLRQDHSSISNLRSEKEEFMETILFASLQVGKETGLVVETEAFKCGKRIELDKQTIRIQDIMFTKLLSHSSQTIRLAGLSFIVSSVSPARPLTLNGLESIKRNLYHLFAETDANVRCDTFRLMQQLIDRVRAAMASLHKTITRSSSAETSTLASTMNSLDTILHAHWTFMQWLLRFLSAGLRPGGSYQRHICSLKVLLTVAKSGIDPSISAQYLSRQSLTQTKWPYHLCIFTPWIERSLLDLTMDAFEDVRSIAVTLLAMNRRREVLSVGTTNTHAHGNAVISARASESSHIDLVQFIARAEEIMLSSGRADHADGVSKAYALLFQKARDEVGGCVGWPMTKLRIVQHLGKFLAHTIEIAEKDLHDAIHRFPIHGTLASIRYIIESGNFYSAANSDTFEHRQIWQSFQTYLIDTIHRVWNCVHDILCHDSPEGHIPEDMENEPDIDTKDILSFSWRALKEASSLLQIIVLKSPIVNEPESESPIVGLKFEGLERLTRLAFTQLTELRHRGAFSVVAHAFTACCLRCRQSGQIGILEMLYNDTLACIRLQGSKVTRRSAGIPSIVVGILSADPEGSLFNRAMTDLKAEAEAPPAQKVSFGDPLPQVHALNCLRAIFLNTILGTSSERHITSCLHLAAGCLTSNIWAIRNCGLMLFKALIDRLLGSTDSQNWSDETITRSSRFTYRDAPGLLEIVTKLLRRSAKQHNLEFTTVESAFPALKLLQRVPPPAGSRAEIRDLVLELCGSQHWHVREMAARTHLALVEQENKVSVITSLLPTMKLRQNQIHGQLLCIRYAVSAVCQNQSRQGVAPVTSRYTELFQNNTCSVTRATYVDILNILSLSLFWDRHLHESLNLSPILTSRLIHEHPLLEKSVALHVLFQRLLRPMTIPTTNQQKPYLETLAIHKPNTFTWMLTDLNSVLYRLPQEISSSILRDFLLEIATTTEVHELATISCKAFMKAIDGQSIAAMSPSNFAELPAIRMFQMKCAPSPAAIASAIQISGRLLDLKCVPENWHQSTCGTLSQLLSKLRRMLEPNEPFDLRHAAVLCLNGFDAFWTLPLTSDGYPPLYLQAILLVYDSLNDDDSEIRELASHTARRILEARSTQSVQPMVPLVASQKLSQHLILMFPTSVALTKEGLWRLTGSRLLNGCLAPSAIQQFSEVCHESTALFAIEKQNLFIDEVREAVIWSRVLKRLSKRALSAEHAAALSKWVTGGLGKLIEVAAEIDGPLGWASKSDTFILGMRIILATDVLLRWRTVTRKACIPGSSLRLLLGRLVATAERGHLHNMWLKLAEEILVNSILGRISVIQGILHGVENSLNVN